MSQSEDDSPPHTLPVTPRRLRSGTPLGEPSSVVAVKAHPASKTSQGVQARKDVCPKKTSREAEKSSSAKKNTPDDVRYGLENHRYEERSTSRHNSSPKKRSQTLNAILESFVPNSLSKIKPSSKRRTLRDLLDQNSFQRQRINHCHSPPETATTHFTHSIKDKGSSKSKDTYYQERLQNKSKNSETVHVFTSPYHSARRSLKSPQSTHSDERAPGQKETSTFNRQATAKREIPDDYWPMRNDYLDREKRGSSRVKAECYPPADETGASQTLRISCSKPEDIGNNRASGPRTDVKPDIVLKVKPRSSSLLTLARAASDIYIASKKKTPERTAKKEQHCNKDDVKPCSSPTPAAPVLSPATDRKYCHVNHTADDSCDEACHSTLGMMLRGSHPTGRYSAFGDTSSCKTSSSSHQEVNHVHHFDAVLEESTLPPVANTVELLTEPHEYHHGNHSHDKVHTRKSHERRVRRDSYESNSPGPPVLEPMTYVNPQSPRSHCGHASGMATGTSETLRAKRDPEETVNEATENLDFKEGVKDEWSDDSKDDENSETGSTIRSTEDFMSFNSKDSETGRQRADSGDFKGMSYRAEREGSVHEEDQDAGNLASDSAESEAGSRRRRKSRPSRRARFDGSWDSGDLYPSPRQDSDTYESDSTQEERIQSRVATPNTRRGNSRRHGEANSGSGSARRGRKSIDLETLWANPQLDTHAFLLWASENRRDVQQQHPDASCSEVERILSVQWRDVCFSSKLHFLCRARDAGTDHDRHTFRKKKGCSGRRESSCTTAEGRSVYEKFTRLPQERQKDLLRKWLRFYQKMLPRLEYQEFINDFKKGCKNLQLRPVSARRKNARLRNLDPSQYKMLFEKIRETRPRVMGVYNKRKVREEQLLWHSFHVMVSRLINEEPWPFMRGCRSKILGELLKDIQQLEVEEALAQIDLPLPLSPADVTDAAGKDNQSPVLGPQAAPSDCGECPRTRGVLCRNSTSRDLISSCAIMEPTSPSGDVELSDNPFVLQVLDGLHHVAELPVLDQRCLDAVFLGPPARVRTSAPRESQFQNSATYRRTMLYKNIQPLLDTRGLPLTTSPLYHSHPAQYFLQGDRM